MLAPTSKSVNLRLVGASRTGLSGRRRITRSSTPRSPVGSSTTTVAGRRLTTSPTPMAMCCSTTAVMMRWGTPSRPTSLCAGVVLTAYLSGPTRRGARLVARLARARVPLAPALPVRLATQVWGSPPPRRGARLVARPARARVPLAPAPPFLLATRAWGSPPPVSPRTAPQPLMRLVLRSPTAVGPSADPDAGGIVT